MHMHASVNQPLLLSTQLRSAVQVFFVLLQANKWNAKNQVGLVIGATDTEALTKARVQVGTSRSSVWLGGLCNRLRNVMVSHRLHQSSQHNSTSPTQFGALPYSNGRMG